MGKLRGITITLIDKVTIDIDPFGNPIKKIKKYLSIMSLYRQQQAMT